MRQLRQLYGSLLNRAPPNRGSGQVRNTRAAGTVVGAFIGRKDSFGFRHDRTVWYELVRVLEVTSLITDDLVSSSDATNIRTSIKQEGNEIVINGRKWYVNLGSTFFRGEVPTIHYRWISGAGDPRTKIHIVMGKSDPNNSNAHQQQSVVLVPADAPGVTVIRPMRVFGYDDAPEGHCEILYENVRVPLSNLVLGWGKGFEVCFCLRTETLLDHNC